MVPASLVRAAVVDITRPGATVPARLVIDASVLYCTHYPNFPNLTLAGGRIPHAYQIREYQRWQAQAQRRGTLLFSPVVTLGEFVRLVEYAELESLWLTDPATPPGSRFDPQHCKRARYTYAARLATVRRFALGALGLLRGAVQVVPQFPSERDALDQACVEWHGSAGDFADALLVAQAKHSGIPHILGDDIDLLTFDGITVYTANRTAIQAAVAASRLVP
jgi:hypothetical protein